MNVSALLDIPGNVAGSALGQRASHPRSFQDQGIGVFFVLSSHLKRPFSPFRPTSSLIWGLKRTGSSSWLGKFANVFSTFNTGKLQIGIPNNPQASSQNTYPWQEETVTIFFFLHCGLRVKKVTCITTQGGNLGYISLGLNKKNALH